MRTCSTTKRLSALNRPARAANPPEPALNVTIVYQDALTQKWSKELWDWVEPVLGPGGTRRKSWSVARLAQPGAFKNAVESAAEADVVLISVRAAGDLPLILRVWIDAWVARRAGRAGALAALIGLPSLPDAQSNRTYQYLEAVARHAGLDFLPRERELPQAPPARDMLPTLAPPAYLTAPRTAGSPINSHCGAPEPRFRC